MFTPKKSSSRVAALILTGFGTFLSPYPVLSETSQVSGALNPVLSDYEVIRQEPGEVRQQVRARGELRLQYKETVFNLRLEPHDMLAPSYRAVETGPGGVRRVLPRGPVTTFKGRLAGQEDTHGRFAVTRRGVEGVVFTAAERYYVEPLQRYLASAGAADLVVYRHSDIKFGQGWKCGVSVPRRLQLGVDRIEAQPAASTATKYLLEVATEADYEFVEALGGSDAANAEILSILNMVDGVYQSELLLELSITFQHTWAVEEDPYTTTDPESLLNEFAAYWRNNFVSSQDYDVAHLWTGRDLYGTTSGIAFIGTACRSRRVALALSQHSNYAPDH